jgi:hypothetical protein
MPEPRDDAMAMIEWMLVIAVASALPLQAQKKPDP